MHLCQIVFGTANAFKNWPDRISIRIQTGSLVSLDLDATVFMPVFEQSKRHPLAAFMLDSTACRILREY